MPSESGHHPFGAAAEEYKPGISTINVKNPPYWVPEIAHRRDYQYTVLGCAKDIRRWCVAIETEARRPGPMVVLRLGGVAGRQ